MKSLSAFDIAMIYERFRQRTNPFYKAFPDNDIEQSIHFEFFEKIAKIINHFEANPIEYFELFFTRTKSPFPKTLCSYNAICHYLHHKYPSSAEEISKSAESIHNLLFGDLSL